MLLMMGLMWLGATMPRKVVHMYGAVVQVDVIVANATLALIADRDTEKGKSTGYWSICSGESASGAESLN